MWRLLDQVLDFLFSGQRWDAAPAAGDGLVGSGRCASVGGRFRGWVGRLPKRLQPPGCASSPWSPSRANSVTEPGAHSPLLEILRQTGRGFEPQLLLKPPARTGWHEPGPAAALGRFQGGPRVCRTQRGRVRGTCLWTRRFRLAKRDDASDKLLEFGLRTGTHFLPQNARNSLGPLLGLQSQPAGPGLQGRGRARTVLVSGAFRRIRFLWRFSPFSLKKQGQGPGAFWPICSAWRRQRSWLEVFESLTENQACFLVTAAGVGQAPAGATPNPAEVFLLFLEAVWPRISSRGPLKAASFPGTWGRSGGAPPSGARRGISLGGFLPIWAKGPGGRATGNFPPTPPPQKVSGPFPLWGPGGGAFFF